MTWLAREGASQLVAELHANNKQLPEAQLDMLRRMLCIEPEKRATLSELARLSYLKPGVATISRQRKTLLGLFCCSKLSRSASISRWTYAYAHAKGGKAR